MWTTASNEFIRFLVGRVCPTLLIAISYFPRCQPTLTAAFDTAVAAIATRAPKSR